MRNKWRDTGNSGSAQSPFYYMLYGTFNFVCTITCAWGPAFITLHYNMYIFMSKVKPDYVASVTLRLSNTWLESAISLSPSLLHCTPESLNTLIVSNRV